MCEREWNGVFSVSVCLCHPSLLMDCYYYARTQTLDDNVPDDSSTTYGGATNAFSMWPHYVRSLRMVNIVNRCILFENKYRLYLDRLLI